MPIHTVYFRTSNKAPVAGTGGTGTGTGGNNNNNNNGRSLLNFPIMDLNYIRLQTPFFFISLRVIPFKDPWSLTPSVGRENVQKIFGIFNSAETRDGI
jgi:hypothetical protein